jgi:hypothetical protein
MLERQTAAARVLEARRGYQAMLSARLAPDQALKPATAALVACAALFEQLAAPGHSGVSAAVAIYEQALAAAPLEVLLRGCHQSLRP